MCVVSMVMEHYSDKWREQYDPTKGLGPQPPAINRPNEWLGPQPAKKPTQEELDEFRKLFERAKQYDKKNNEPNCEMAEKKQALKKIADALGIDISFIDK